MEDLSDLIFDPNTGEFSVNPSTSLKEMQNLISNDNKDELKEIEDIFCRIGPMPKFGNPEDCIIQDGESIKENETDVQ